MIKHCLLRDELLFLPPPFARYDLGNVDTGIRRFLVKYTSMLNDPRFLARNGFSKSTLYRWCGTWPSLGVGRQEDGGNVKKILMFKGWAPLGEVKIRSARLNILFCTLLPELGH